MEEGGILAKLVREVPVAVRAQLDITARQRGGEKLELLEAVLDFHGLITRIGLLYPTQQLHARIAKTRNGF